MTTRNPNQISPAPEYAEVGRQFWDVQLAENNRRTGPAGAEEGLGTRLEIARGMQAGLARGYIQAPGTPYDRKIADGRSPLADGSAASRGPAWDVVRPEETSSFAAAGDFGDPGQTKPYPFAPRDGFNKSTITPLDGLARGERQNTHMLAVEVRNPRNRRNPATVFGADDVR